MKRSVFIAFLVIFTLLPRYASAFVARGDTVYIDGYTSWNYVYKNDSASDNHMLPNVLWINANKKIQLPWENGYSYMYVSASLRDRVGELQESGLKWPLSFGPVDEIKIGRFVPAFAKEWSEKTLDQLNLPGGYSPIYNQLPYADNGVQIDMHKKRLHFSLGSFLGERSGGVLREQKDGKVHLYSKAVFIFPWNIEIGSSYRWSRTRSSLWAASAKWFGRSKNISFEAVGFGEDVQWFGNYGVEITPHCVITVRYENLKYLKNRSTLGIRIHTRNIDVKIAPVLLGHFMGRPPRWAQLDRWVKLDLLFRF